ncbi:MAG: hypothetical protein R3Y64_10730 [Peptostreptococcaceae bacterium]
MFKKVEKRNFILDAFKKESSCETIKPLSSIYSQKEKINVFEFAIELAIRIVLIVPILIIFATVMEGAINILLNLF